MPLKQVFHSSTVFLCLERRSTLALAFFLFFLQNFLIIKRLVAFCAISENMNRIFEPECQDCSLTITHSLSTSELFAHVLHKQCETLFRNETAAQAKIKPDRLSMRGFGTEPLSLSFHLNTFKCPHSNNMHFLFDASQYISSIEGTL